MKIRNKNIKKIISLVAIIGLITMGGYWFFEPTLINAADAPDIITVTQGVTQEITISHPADVTMSATIPGVTGNPGVPRTGSTLWQVKTTNAAGFILKLNAGVAPAMVLDGTYHFDDYSPAGAVPDYAWASPAGGEAEFGFTVEAETIGDEVLAFRDAGAAPCGAGALNTADTCWWNFTALDYTVINRATNTDSGGEDETVKFQTESNAKFLKEGSYVATITATATEN